ARRRRVGGARARVPDLPQPLAGPRVTPGAGVGGGIVTGLASDAVRVERDGPVTVMTIDRPEVRNAVDRPTAEALADAFRTFDADDGTSVAVLTGAGGTFCAGADLKGVADGRGNRVVDDMDADGPMGPT